MTHWQPMSRGVAVILLVIGLCYCQNTAESVVKNPAFQEVAPCPCDLTKGSCDLRCCCDSDCSADLKSIFDYCTPGLPGGQDAAPQEYKCASNHLYKDDWFPLLCVVFEYNAFLGYFYEWQYKIGNNTQAFLQRLSSVFFFSYREQEERQVDDSPGTGYQYGVSVKTAKLVSSEIDLYGVLTLPQPTLTGHCLQTAPVRFLKDIDSSCTYTMTSDLCGSNTVLSSLFYIQSSSLTTATQYFSPLQEDDGLVLAETNVAYYCANDASAYLKSSSATNVVGSVLFDYSLPANPNCTDSCGNDICIDLNDLADPDPPAASGLPGLCNSQLPIAPNNDNGICRNSVVEVQYTMTWTGKKVIKVDANIILADIPLRNGLVLNEVTPKYSVNFVHNFTGESAGATDNFNNITDTSYARSGRVGYEIGKPIFSGSLVYNDSATPPEFMYVNTNSTRQISVFSPAGADGLCANASRRSIKFGEDLSTGCRLQLALTDLEDCSGLRKLIINRLNALMPSDVLGRRGYNDVKNNGYWLEVLREDLSMLCIASEYYPVGLSPVDNRTGICRNITSGINLDVLYAETGRSNNYSIYEILGARISYTTSTWEVNCGSPSGRVCDSDATQSFFLTSSVKFTKVPAQTPEPIPKYYETPEEDDPQLCPQDRCWDNLFYPLDGRFVGMGDSKEYVFAMVGSAIVFFIGYLLVTRPWW